MGVKERKEREKEELKNRILEATEKLLRKEGYMNLSVRKIANEIEYSPATIYLYFKDKTDLVYTLVKSRFDNFQKALVTAYGEETNPLELLKIGLKTLISRGIENPNFYMAVFLNDLENQEMAGQIISDGALRSDGFKILMENLKNAVDQGITRKVDPELTAMTLWSSAVGLMIMLISQHSLSAEEKEASINDFLNVVCIGLKK